MKVRVFTLNKDKKIELTKDELQKLLDEVYCDGASSVTITTPSWSSTICNVIDTKTTVDELVGSTSKTTIATL